MTAAEQDALRLTDPGQFRFLPSPPRAPEPPRRCDGCSVWDREGTTGVGFCRRHAPLVARVTAKEIETVWPETFAEDWCGEFRAKAVPR